ncbi:MAG TPA: histidinol dehydrogenase, partial [Burkholderiales bacterium]|nr:histidinol dehydrogenase [Burkholderiales bacterium]
MNLRRLSTRDAGFDAGLEALTRFDAAQDPAVHDAVRAILADVRARGDAAVLEYTGRFDRISVSSVDDLEHSLSKISLPGAQGQALRLAHQRIKAFHERQLQSSWQYTEADGTRLGQRITPLERVGLYVPGGKAAYPSSVLMNAVPAKVAGVRELIMVSPNPNELVLAAAALAGVDRVIGIGGAQAVA